MKNVSLIVLTALLLMVGCSDETTIYENPADNLVPELDVQKLEGSVLFDKAGVLDIYEDPIASAKRYGVSGKAEQAGDYPLTLIAQVAPPSFAGGENLAATHVFIEGDFGYVSYNTVGQDYVGAIDIINISDPNNPTVSSRLYFNNADLNSIVYDNGYVYVVGGVDAEKSVTATANSVLAKIPAINGRLDSGSLITAYQEGFNATDVIVKDNKVLVTSGQDGFLVAYDKNDLSVLSEAAFTDLRSVATNGSDIAVLDASQGVSFLDENLAVTRSIAINSDFGVDAKRSLDFSNENIVVAEGANGAGLYNAASGDFVKYLPILLNPANAETGDIVTNGVAVNQDVLFMANGAAGLSLSDKKNDTTEGVGVIELTGSINYVASKGDYIFAASGRSGFQIIKLNRPSESLVAKCSNLLDFDGSTNYSVLEGQTEAFSGSKRFNSLTISGSLLLCGTWTVSNDITVNDNALFEMNGAIVVGRFLRRRNVVVKKGATLRIEGNLTVYGDIILEDGATLNFVGDAATAVLYGNLIKDVSSTITGTYTDYFNNMR